MKVVIVGGHDCMHCRYKEICKKYGCKCKVFTQNATDLKNKIGSPDILIVFTRTVAHKMAIVASEQATKVGAIIKYCNCSSACALNDALCECIAN